MLPPTASVTVSLYLPVTNPVLANVEQPRSLALFLPQCFVRAIITALLIKVSVYSNRQDCTVAGLRTGRHMNRDLIPGRRVFSSERPHRLWGPTEPPVQWVTEDVLWGKVAGA